MSTEMERQTADKKNRAFFEAEIYRSRTEAEIVTVLNKYSNSNFPSEYVTQILQYAGSAHLSPAERQNFTEKIKSILLGKNQIETQKPSHLSRPARQR